MIGDYGIDWEGPTPSDSSEIDMVEVPETSIPMNCLADIEANVDSLAHSEEYGMDLYLQALQIVTTASHVNDEFEQ
jgi:hypothetical protein